VLWSTDGATLNLYEQLIGQPTAFDPFGSLDFSDGGNGGDFNLYAADSSAPDGGYWFFTLTTADDTGDPMALTSFEPVPEPSSLLLFCTGLLGVAGTLRRKLMA
jgi:hypothetical protein